jgi:SAM-dependent methyltransferase
MHDDKYQAERHKQAVSMRVLDLGCGPGSTALEAVWGVSGSDEIIGVDVDPAALEKARQRFPRRKYLTGSGERIPLEDESLDRVISSVALNYMAMPQTLFEIYRVLAPGGRLSLSLHPVSYTLKEIRMAWPRPIPLIFRSYVLANGWLLHLAGRTIPFITGKTEHWVSERGMRIALQRAGFKAFTFSRRPGAMNWMLTVEATK